MTIRLKPLSSMNLALPLENVNRLDSLSLGETRSQQNEHREAVAI